MGRILFRPRIRLKFLSTLTENKYVKQTSSSLDIPSLLRGFANRKAFSEGKYIHQYIIHIGLGRDRFFGNLLIDMYGKCGALQDARFIFDLIAGRNLFSWNMIISAYIQQGHVLEAFELFQAMPKRDVVSWNLMLSAYSQQGYTHQAAELFGQMPVRNAVSWTIMIGAYSQQGLLKQALEFFVCMPSRDTVAWNTMIAGYIREGHLQEAFDLFEQMPERDMISWNAMIAGYTQAGQLKQALQLFKEMPEKDIISWNTMITAYAQQGHLSEALSLFIEMPAQDLVSWNALIAASIKQGELQNTLELFHHMPRRDVISYTTILVAYSQQGEVNKAIQFFQGMPERDVVAWNVMLGICAHKGLVEQAFQLFQQMQEEGLKPDKNTFTNVLHACAEAAALEQGKQFHKQLVDSDSALEMDILVGSSLIIMYGKCGSLDNAEEIFCKIGKWNIPLCNAIIAAYAQHGDDKKVFKLFSHMQHVGLVADHVTFANLLSACSHAGLIDQGCQILVSSSSDHYLILKLEHYSCVIDLLGRIQWLEEAECLISSMPYEGGVVPWTSLLCSCRNQADRERAKRAAEYILELDPHNAAAFVLFSNMCAAVDEMP